MRSVNARRRWVALLCVSIAAMFQLATNGMAGDITQSTAADALFDSGLTLQIAAEKTKAPADAVALYRKAIDKYRAAAAVRPDFCRAKVMWAHCLFCMGKDTSDPQTQRGIIFDAEKLFAATAASCPDADWLLYYDWGNLLADEAGNFREDLQQRHAWLMQGRKEFQTALDLAGSRGDRARIERDLGRCVLELAQDSNDPAERRALFHEAITHFESATKTAGESNTARIYGLWGVAILQLAKLEDNRLMVRQSVERLETCLEKDPADLEAQYNLACAYGLMDQPGMALPHLCVCLDNDPQRTFYNAATEDPDLNSLRGTREFNEIFNPPPESTTSATPEPSTSGR